MELLEYLNKYGLPEKEEDMSLEQSVIFECTKDIITEAKYKLLDYLSFVFKYVLHQEEFTYDQTCRVIDNILFAHREIDSITDCYINPSQYMIDHAKLDDEEKEWLDFNHDDNEKALLQKYIGSYDAKNKVDIQDLIKQDARTDNAKKYFHL